MPMSWPLPPENVAKWNRLECPICFGSFCVVKQRHGSRYRCVSCGKTLRRAQVYITRQHKTHQTPGNGLENKTGTPGNGPKEG